MSLEENAIGDIPFIPPTSFPPITVGDLFPDEMIETVVSIYNVVAPTIDFLKNVGPTAAKCSGVAAVISVASAQVYHFYKEHPPRSYADEMYEGRGLGFVAGAIAGYFVTPCYVEANPWYGAAFGSVSGAIIGDAAGWTAKFLRGRAPIHPIVSHQVEGRNSDTDTSAKKAIQLSASLPCRR